MAAAMTLHPLAWTAWLAGVCVFAFAVSNPYTLAVGLACVGLVHLASPRGQSPFGGFLVFGVVLLAIRVLFVSLLDAPGATVLAELPRLELPGGIGIGGTVTAEVLVASGIEGLQLLCVLAAFGVWTTRVELSSVVRMLPGPLRDAGLVTGIAAAFVPGLVRTARDVRDAQRLRGEPGLRTVAPSLAVPVLGLTLERALLLAESMDARGYGHGAVAVSQRLMTAGLVALLASVVTWVAGFGLLASAFAAAGAALLIRALWEAAVASPTTRLAPPAWTPRGAAVALGAFAAAAAAFAVASYSPYPAVGVPDLGFGAALPGLLLAVPAALEVTARPVKDGAP